MKIGVVIFPGSNCDHDAFWTVEQVMKQPVTFLWHESRDLANCDAIIAPGGFTYGDNRIVFRYCTPSGEVVAEANPNGSLDDIAGICSPGGNVVGMMPHPERASEPALGCTDGIKIFESVVRAGVGAAELAAR